MSDFKTHHFAIIDVLEDEDQLVGEQDILDKHADEVADHISDYKHIPRAPS